MNIQSRKKERWTKTSTAARRLREDFVTGAIAPDKFNSKEVQQTRPVYLEYDTVCFSRNLTQIARDYAKVLEAGSPNLEKWIEDGKTLSDQQGK